MDFDLKKGMIGKVESIVSIKETAITFGSGGVEVYATPMMVGLIENASLKAVDKFLPDGYATVGTHLDISHIAATPVGMKVWAEAELIEINGKVLTFKVVAFDEVEKIGEGNHKRFIVSLDKFMGKNKEKAGRR